MAGLPTPASQAIASQFKAPEVGENIVGTNIPSSGDTTIDQYKLQYEQARQANDPAGMASAAQGADDYRESIGQPRENTAHAQALMEQAKQQPEQEQLTIERFNQLWAERNAQWQEEQKALMEAQQPQPKQIMQNQQAISDLLDTYLSDFAFDAMGSEQYKQQSKLVEREIRERFAARGIRDATFVESEITRAMQDLAYKIEDAQYTKWKDKSSKLMEVAGFLQKLDQDAFENATTVFNNKLKSDAQELQLRKQDFEEGKKEVEIAFDRWEEMGYADEIVSMTLGVPIGTPSNEMMKYEIDWEIFKREEDYKAEIDRAKILLENMIANDPNNPDYKKKMIDLEKAEIQKDTAYAQKVKAEIQAAWEESQQSATYQSKATSTARTQQLIEKGEIDIAKAEKQLEDYNLDKEKEKTIVDIANSVFTTSLTRKEAEDYLLKEQSEIIDSVGSDGYIAVQDLVKKTIEQKESTMRGFREEAE
jgi:hypothetical protein